MSTTAQVTSTHHGPACQHDPEPALDPLIYSTGRVEKSHLPLALSPAYCSTAMPFAYQLPRVAAIPAH